MQLPRMRLPFIVVGLLLAAFAPLHAAEVELARVWPGWRDAESFERVSEFFTGKENAGKQVILRSRPETRGGYYFLVRAINPGGEIAGTKFVLQIITPAQPLAKTFTFSSHLAPGTTAYREPHA